MPNAWDIRGWQDTNSFNGNIWSLYWEYLANICYAFFLRFVPTIVLAALTVVAAVATLDLTLNLNLFGLISESRVGAPYTVNGGWSLAPSELYVGAVRLGYPFLVGMMLSRTKRLVRMKGGFVWTALLVTALLLMPAFEGIANGVYETFAILVIMPLIVSIGAGSQLTGRKYNDACKFLGDLSYPLYITHLPVVSLQIAYVSNHPEAPLSNLIMVSVLTFFLSVAVPTPASNCTTCPCGAGCSRSGRSVPPPVHKDIAESGLAVPASGGDGHGQSLWDTCCTLRKEPLTLQTPRASSAHATAGLHST